LMDRIYEIKETGDFIDLDAIVHVGQVGKMTFKVKCKLSKEPLAISRITGSHDHVGSDGEGPYTSFDFCNLAKVRDDLINAWKEWTQESEALNG